MTDNKLLELVINLADTKKYKILNYKSDTQHSFMDKANLRAYLRKTFKIKNHSLSKLLQVILNEKCILKDSTEPCIEVYMGIVPLNEKHKEIMEFLNDDTKTESTWLSKNDYKSMGIPINNTNSIPINTNDNITNDNYEDIKSEIHSKLDIIKNTIEILTSEMLNNKLQNNKMMEKLDKMNEKVSNADDLLSIKSEIRKLTNKQIIKDRDLSIINENNSSELSIPSNLDTSEIINVYEMDSNNSNKSNNSKHNQVDENVENVENVENTSSESESDSSLDNSEEDIETSTDTNSSTDNSSISSDSSDTNSKLDYLFKSIN